MEYPVVCERASCRRKTTLTKPGRFCSPRCRTAHHRERQALRIDAAIAHATAALATDNPQALTEALRRTIVLLSECAPKIPAR